MTLIRWWLLYRGVRQDHLCSEECSWVSADRLSSKECSWVRAMGGPTSIAPSPVVLSCWTEDNIVLYSWLQGFCLLGQVATTLLLNFAYLDAGASSLFRLKWLSPDTSLTVAQLSMSARDIAHSHPGLPQELHHQGRRTFTHDWAGEQVTLGNPALLLSARGPGRYWTFHHLLNKYLVLILSLERRCMVLVSGFISFCHLFFWRQWRLYSLEIISLLILLWWLKCFWCRA